MSTPLTSQPLPEVAAICESLGYGHNNKESSRYYIKFRDTVIAFRKEFLQSKPVDQQRLDDMYSPQIRDCAARFLEKHKNLFEDSIEQEDEILNLLAQLIFVQEKNHQQNLSSKKRQRTVIADENNEDKDGGDFHGTDELSTVDASESPMSILNQDEAAHHESVDLAERRMEKYLTSIYIPKPIGFSDNSIVMPNKRFKLHTLCFLARYQHGHDFYNLNKISKKMGKQLVTDLKLHSRVTATSAQDKIILKKSLRKMQGNIVTLERSGYIAGTRGSKSKTAMFARLWKRTHDVWVEQGNDNFVHSSVEQRSARPDWMTAAPVQSQGTKRPLPGISGKVSLTERSTAKTRKRRKVIASGQIPTPGSTPENSSTGDAAMSEHPIEEHMPDLYGASPTTSPSFFQVPEGQMNVNLSPFECDVTSRESPASSARSQTEPIVSCDEDFYMPKPEPASDRPFSAFQNEEGAGRPHNESNNKAIHTPKTATLNSKARGINLYFILADWNIGSSNPLPAKEIFDNSTLDEFFTLVCERTQRPRNFVPQLTFTFNWTDIDPMIVEASGEESWPYVKGIVKARFSKGIRDYPELEKFGITVICPDIEYID